MIKSTAIELVPNVQKGVWVRTAVNPERGGFMHRLGKGFRASAMWLKGIIVSSVILAILFFIIYNFYIYSSIVNLDSFFYIFLILSVATDGTYVLLQLLRRPTKPRNLSYNRTKLTIVISCYNGEDVLDETITQALKHVPPEQIIVVSDASTDKTVEIAKKYGVRIIENKTNLNKAFSISKAVKQVNTPYTLVLDDDTLIGDTFIPTSLLDDGYTAVSFNVMPVVEEGLLNSLQQFEYRMSMQVSKNYRGASGGIGNISGAIGLYRTADLQKQSAVHSGQFAGEDEQRTLLAHLSGEGKGITYTDAIVKTKVPKTLRQLYKQRAYSWSLAVPELFVLYWKILLQPRHHFLLKAEKGYQLYVYLTDPLRMLFFWTLFLKPSHIALTYSFYAILNILIWLRMGARDNFLTVLLFPLYSLWLTICRFVGDFYWLVAKMRYLSKRMYRYVTRRKVVFEYGLLFATFCLIWTISVRHFSRDLELLSRIKTHHLEQTTKNFDYENTNGLGTLPSTLTPVAPDNADYLLVPLETGDTNRAVAHKAIDMMSIEQRQVLIDESIRWKADDYLAASITADDYLPTNCVRLQKSLISIAIQKAKSES